MRRVRLEFLVDTDDDKAARAMVRRYYQDIPYMVSQLYLICNRIRPEVKLVSDDVELILDKDKDKGN